MTRPPPIPAAPCATEATAPSGEFARIERLRARLEMANDAVEVGIGDDAAVVRFASVRSAISVDTAIENVHFRRSWLSPRDIGYRSQIAAMSDLAAMGATPRFAVLALALPPDFSDADLDDLADGIREAKQAVTYDVVGGNLARASELSITTTVLGDPPERPMTRAGAQVGDSVFVTGEIGAASLGLIALERGTSDACVAPFVARWRRPPHRHDASPKVTAIASAAIDVSDGLLQDAAHLARASSVDVVLRVANLPRHADWLGACATLGVDPLTFGLGGGEDYELLFTTRDRSRAARFATEIGVVRVGPGRVIAEGEDGAPLTLASEGHDHFARG